MHENLTVEFWYGMVSVTVMVMVRVGKLMEFDGRSHRRMEC